MFKLSTIIQPISVMPCHVSYLTQKTSSLATMQWDSVKDAIEFAQAHHFEYGFVVLQGLRIAATYRRVDNRYEEFEAKS